MSDPTLIPDEPVLKTNLDIHRGAGSSWAVNLSPEIGGLPAIVVPAGFMGKYQTKLWRETRL